MLPVIKYLTRNFLLSYVIGLAAIGAIAVALNLLWPDGILDSYLSGYPTFTMIMALIMPMTISGALLDVALSMGSRRRDYFAGIQAVILVSSVISVAFIYAVYLVVQSDLLARYDYSYYYYFSPELAPHTAVLIFAAHLIGAGAGALSQRRKWLSMLIFGASTMILTTISIVQIAARAGLWGDLVWILSLVVIILAAVLEVVLWRHVSRATVR